ncbi:MAG: hypothetical protein ACI4PD_07765 [Butyricicoccus sp.]
MADVIYLDTFDEEPDIGAMNREELLSCLDTLREKISALDELEPRDMDSEEYEDWGERHEQLEDLVDEILDRLDDME